jgi:hypothetical protein
MPSRLVTHGSRTLASVPLAPFEAILQEELGVEIRKQAEVERRGGRFLFGRHAATLYAKSKPIHYGLLISVDGRHSISSIAKRGVPDSGNQAC